MLTINPDHITLPSNPSTFTYMPTISTSTALTVSKPTVRRLVSYWSYGTPNGEFPSLADRAAIITEVDEPNTPTSAVGLCVLNPSGLFFNQHVPYSASPKAGCWSWPTSQIWGTYSYGGNA